MSKRISAWWHANQNAVVGVLVAAVVALTLLCGLLVKGQGDTLDKVTRETADRRDQACKGWEQAHAVEIRDLEQSYAFYRDPPPEFKGLLDSPVALASLAERVRNAANDRDAYGQFVPAYCDEKGVGVKEPDPVVPSVPPRIALLLSELKVKAKP